MAFQAIVQNYVADHNEIIPAEFLESQDYSWTEGQQMFLNQKKTKVMVFNFTDNL